MLAVVEAYYIKAGAYSCIDKLVTSGEWNAHLLRQIFVERRYPLRHLVNVDVIC